MVNAASERDMAFFAAGMIKEEMKGKNFLCRTIASFGLRAMHVFYGGVMFFVVKVASLLKIIKQASLHIY